MQAVVFRGDGVVEAAEAPDPALEHDGDAIVRVVRWLGSAAPISMSSTATSRWIRGRSSATRRPGSSSPSGAEVRTVSPGDRVVASFQIACGVCWFCRTGQIGLCENHRMLGGGPFGGDLHGAQAGFVRVPVADVNLLPIPDGVGR